MNMQYALKTVIFDIEKDCQKLKLRLKEAGIFVKDVSFCEFAAKGHIEWFYDDSTNAQDCLLLTNQELHARAAKKLGMAIAACSSQTEEKYSYHLLHSVPLLEEPEEVSVWYLNQIYCHAKKIPAVILETNRCILREMGKNDIKPLCEILKEVANSFHTKWEYAEQEEQLLSYVSHVYEFFSYGYWGVFLKESKELIGRAGFLEGSYPPEVGYVLTPFVWGKGLATEIVQALLHLAEEEFDSEEVVAKAEIENKASFRVLEKCGFQRIPEETIENKEKIDGKNIQWFSYRSERR